MAQSITLQNLADTAIVDNDILGQLCFAAPNEAGGTDSILISASIFARSEGTFAADNNATELVFVTGSSESAAPGATNYDMTLSSAGNLTVAGTLTCATSLTIGSAAMSEADLEFLDGITAGTAAASKAVVLDGSKNIATIGTIGCGAITSTGSSSFATSVKTPLIEYTDGDDSMTIADGGKVTFAAGFAVGSDASGDILYHNGTSYVRLAKGSDDEVLTLASGLPSWAAASGGGSMSQFILEDDDGTEVSISNNEEVKFIGSGITTNWTDTTPGSDGDPFDLTFTVDAAQTGITSVYNASLKMGRDSQNLIDFATTDNKIILRVNNVDEVELVENALSPVTSDGVALGTGSLMWSDLFLASGAVVNFNNGDVTLTHSSNTLTVAGGNLAATLSTAAQTNITSLGTLTALTVDDVAIDGKVITMTGSTNDTAVFTVGTHGTLSIVTTDTAAAAANIQITADGTVDIDSAGVLTLDSGAAINIEPAAGSAILLDGTISIDAGVVTGATSITSTAFVGDITGDVTGNASGTAATVTGAAQTNITTVGTLTTLTVDSIIINGTTIGHTSDTDAIAIASGGAVTFSQATKPALKSNTDGTTVTFDLDVANVHTVTLGGNRTFAISNETAGQKFIIRVLQDGTGSRLVSTWFSTIKWAGGSAPTLTTTASKADVFGFLVTGTDTYDGFVVGQNI